MESTDSSEMTLNGNNDCQKRCNCKKTKCLKRYCDCFAAGLYCAESCSCQECFNSLDHEDIVDQKREQLEVKNPLAFSSKISNIHNVEDVDQLTTIAIKHIKGCNCMKSKCVRRYCECYEANAGCSNECRCQGCKNVYGKRGEDNTNKVVYIPVLENPQNMTPSTSFGHSCYENDSSTSGRYIPSIGYDNSDKIPLDQESYPNVEFMNQFTASNNTNIDVGHPDFRTNLSLKMECPNSSRVNETLYAVIKSWPNSVITTQVPLFGDAGRH